MTAELSKEHAVGTILSLPHSRDENRSIPAIRATVRRAPRRRKSISSHRRLEDHAGAGAELNGTRYRRGELDVTGVVRCRKKEALGNSEQAARVEGLHEEGGIAVHPIRGRSDHYGKAQLPKSD